MKKNYISSGKRIADEPVYLKETDYSKPKEIFKFMGELIPRQYYIGSSVLDAGCATGHFLHYLSTIMEGADLSGIDISYRMISYAREHVPEAKFRVGSILNKRSLGGEYDVVVCGGVISLLDDPLRPFKNLLSCVKKDGILLVSSVFNDDPIDVVMRYRRVGSRNDFWEKGWNIFSRKTIDRILASSGHKLEWEWHCFKMPFSINKKSDDPMRSWTIAAGKNRHQLVNGACQLMYMRTLRVHMLKPKGT